MLGVSVSVYALQSNGMDPLRCTPNLVWGTMGG